jgi:hypothetical protein
MSWQPIEMAPKDGTVVLLTDGVCFSAGAYESDGWWRLYGCASFEADVDTEEFFEPTHWQPRLEPPPK